MLISRPFRVALEGQTTDGRKIQRDWIDQMAATYDPAKYGARIWMEHLRSLLPDGPFAALGDVVGLEAMDVEVDGKPRRALYATISPTPELVAINQRRQKVYTSIEVDPDFTGSGKAYLMGLGITDTPASLGTEMLRFASEHPAVLAARKRTPESLIGEALEAELSFDEQPDPKPGLLARLKEILSGQARAQDGRADALEEGLINIAQELALLRASDSARAERFASLDDVLERFADRIDELEARLTQGMAEQTARLSALQAQLDQTPAQPDQPLAPATGGPGATRTDC